MQFSESWLRSFVDPALDSEALAHVLTMGGLEVEEVTPVAPAFEKVVVAKVVECARHPNADRLSVCQVDAGQASLLTIVCGAPNVRAGQKVPCALVGARLPAAPGESVFEIKAATMRGVESQGMLCSARELKLSEDHAGLLVLPDDAPIGASLREVLDLDDKLFTLKLTPNKADCLSVFGVAREVAALTGAALRRPSFPAVAPTLDERLKVSVADADLCGRFSGRIVRGVDARAQTPAWMKQRLERSGQRSVSALVDISNYVMLELGRPSHVFDLAKIHGALTVRWGRAGESLKLLNGETVEVDAHVGVIVDEEAVESLAGIMGGDATAVSLETRDIYLEAAFWWPDAIQGRARRYNFSTDASHRFERGVDPATTLEHLEYITALVLQICGGKAGPIDDQQPRMPQPREVAMRLARAQKIIGVAVSRAEIAAIFARLEFKVREDGDSFIVTPPSYRFDIEIEEDLIEEVARCYGYERIPTHLPIARHSMLRTDEATRSIHDLRHLLAASGYQEVLNYSFVDAQWEADFAGNAAPIALINPIASHLSVMRTSLLGGLVANLRYNLNRKNLRVRVFELARVFLPTPGSADGELAVAGIEQPLRAAGLAYGGVLEDQWGASSRAVDFFDVKKDVEELLAPRQARFVAASHPALHPGRSARVEVDGRACGWIGELHPRWLQRYELPQAPIVFELDAALLLQGNLPRPTEISRFPAVVRDLALVVDSSLQVQALLDEIDSVRQSDGPATLVQSVAIFDEYRGKGLKNNEKSLAFRFRLQDTHQTLSDEVVDLALAAIKRALHEKFGANPRT